MCLKAKIYPSIGYLLPLPATGMYDSREKMDLLKRRCVYLDSITERQDLCLNMTKMGDEEVKKFDRRGAEKLNAELKIGLSSDKLLKTGGYNKHTNKKKT